MLIDSNLLIYALNDDAAKQKKAQAFIRSLKQPVLAQQNIFETVKVVTHHTFPTAFSAQEAVEIMDILSAQIQIVSPTSFTHSIALELLQKYSVTGTEVSDAYLVATALSHNITKIATDNVKHLGIYQEIEIINPF
jgi:predicted nucleic acid-binding protein